MPELEACTGAEIRPCGSAINWNDETPITVTGVRFYRHRTNVNFNGAIQLSRNVKFSVLVRNAFNAPQLVMEKSGDNPRMVQQYTSWGTSWTFSLKSTF